WSAPAASRARAAATNSAFVLACLPMGGPRNGQHSRRCAGPHATTACPDKCHGSTHASSLISGTLKGPGPDATIVRGIDPRPPTRRLGARLLDCHRLGTADPIRRLARPSRRHRHVGEGLPERGDPPPGGGGDRWDVQLIEDVEVTGVITTTSQTCGLPGT